MIICGPIVLGTYALIFFAWIQHSEWWVQVCTRQNEGQCWLATQLESLWTGAALILVAGNIFHGFHHVPMAVPSPYPPPTWLVLASLRQRKPWKPCGRIAVRKIGRCLQQFLNLLCAPRPLTEPQKELRSGGPQPFCLSICAFLNSVAV